MQSLQRGLAVIRAFDADNPTLTLSDVARSTGLARAAARRFLLTLVDLGYIRVDGRQFRLSPQVLELGRAYLSSLRIPQIALPHLRDVTDELRESSSLAVLDGTDIVYVAHAPAKRILSITIDIGTRDPAFATSLGRVLLAGQDDDWLDHYLATVELPAITPRTINTPDKLRSRAHADPPPRLGARRPGARRRPPRHRRTHPRRARQRHRRRQPRRPRQPLEQRRHPPHPPPPPPPNHHRHRPRHQRSRTTAGQPTTDAPRPPTRHATRGRPRPIGRRISCSRCSGGWR